MSNLQSEDNFFERIKRIFNIRWKLFFYDTLIYLFSGLLFFYLHPSMEKLSSQKTFLLMFVGFVCVFSLRLIIGVYKQILRYGGMGGYVSLFFADSLGGFLFYLTEQLFLPAKISFVSSYTFVSFNLFVAIAIRIVYYYMYIFAKSDGYFGEVFRNILHIFGGIDVSEMERDAEREKHPKIKVAIVGAGRVGSALAKELRENKFANYEPVLFIDIDKNKNGMEIYGIPVMLPSAYTNATIAKYGVQEIVFAVPDADAEKRKKLYDFYSESGCKIKVYDYPTLNNTKNGKRTLREFDTEELLFRKPITINSEETSKFYNGKSVLITGGGGSIGSELARQVAKMKPSKLILLDICENGVYDVQQELKLLYHDDLKLFVEILSVCDVKALDKVFYTYHPQIVIHAAAHKHVPLMEHNVCEAVKNNIFGTYNVVRMCEKYDAMHFIMVSTDKAVNPTNVMGATKRFCELIMEEFASKKGKCIYSATRFGNVLGSAGSVIPLFKRQIANGGPVTITDKRIIRYFMTIPEASQLVLESGSMAKQGELFVLDMGKPIKILELAESMIRLSGMEPYEDIDIVETGLRPGEKLYEELLIKSDTLTKTLNELIFIEKDEFSKEIDVELCLKQLKEALEDEDDARVKEEMHRAVPTYKAPEIVNAAIS